MDAEPRDNNESIQHLFDSGFESGELGPVFDEAPLSSLVPISSIPLPTVSVSLPALTPSICLPISTAPISVPLATSTAPASAPVLVSTSFPSIPSIPSTAPLPSVHHTKTGSSSGNMSMRSVTLEVPANHSLLRKTGRADANLISTELMRRISLLERKARESEKSIHEAEEIARGAQLEATNWKEQFENAQGTIEELQEDKNLLEQQNRGLTSELSELAKVIDTIEKSQQSTDTPSPALEVPENVAIPASEGETSTTQSMEVEASVTIPSTE
ncbi:uncharacterized protein [Nicotiana sylvestris]|uniref:uncharacterized protein n=1 Tax=Nicotiana sylvestris TaxID=4096 RepID=UPI00388C65F0